MAADIPGLAPRLEASDIDDTQDSGWPAGEIAHMMNISRFADELDPPAQELLKTITCFIIAMPKFDEEGNKVKPPLMDSEFVSALLLAGMKVKVLENPCRPCTKHNSSGQPYVGDVGYKFMFTTRAVWHKMQASPSSLGCLISHLNCWGESTNNDPRAWCMVMEEDVVPGMNSAHFFASLLNMMTTQRFREHSFELIHLVHDTENHHAVSRIHKEPVLVESKTMQLVRAPREVHPHTKKMKHVNVGQGTRAYLIHGKLMAELLDPNYKYHTWIDMEVALGCLQNIA